MNTELKSYNTNEPISFFGVKPSFVSNSINPIIEEETAFPEILFITSFPPRECGIATYTQDLVSALRKQFSNTFDCSICALESDNEQHEYAQKPKYILNTDQRNSFAKTAFEINKNKNICAVVIQHEFGFFADKESDFTLLLNSITKPIILVYHTVLPNPSIALKYKVQQMSTIASSIIVMTNNASQILINSYNILSSKISVIPHGTHLVAPINKHVLKEEYNLTDRKILSTFGLLSSNKGIEVTLNALPAIINKHPDVLFLILGKTHPSVVKHDGEKYRQMLEDKVTELNISDNVRFVNSYLQLPILLEYLQLTDIYLFTSNDPNQAVSGTFSYAISAGCPIISTPIPHAKELLNHETGLFFDFEDSNQLAIEVIQLLNDQELRDGITLNALHKMAPTAWENSAISHAKLFERLYANDSKLQFNVPEINIDHIQLMTTDFGMIQFSKIAHPDSESGYTLDDNARALIAICQKYEITPNSADLELIKIYLNFIQFCMQENGKFMNYVDFHKNFSTQNDFENLEDSNGRAIWAIGYICSLKGVLPNSIIDQAQSILRKAIPNLETIHSTRAMAFILKGLHYQNSIENLHIIKTFADRLVQMYRHESKNDWNWFESYMTYGNSLLPEALLCAYLSTNNKTYKTVAKDSFDFLLSKIFNGDKIQVISNKGWLYNNTVSDIQIGGEQPIDVAYTVIALENFHLVFGDNNYCHKAKLAFNWFLGENHLHQIVYNPCTGGCYDGIEEHNVNLNQGAESTLSYLMARLAIDRMLAYEKTPIIFNTVLPIKMGDFLASN